MSASPRSAEPPPSRRPAPTTGSLVGSLIRLTVAGVAHGGHCVARITDTSGAPAEQTGRVVFVRHALPGEQVTAVVTEDQGQSFCRADAVDIHRPSPDRVDAPCPYSGPGQCGGCDWQHVSPDGQRRLKTTVVREAMSRFADLHLPADFAVEPLTGTLLHWRSRTIFAVDRSTAVPRLGMRAHRSHRVVAVQSCAICAPAIASAPRDRFDPAAFPADVANVEYLLGDAGAVTTVAHRGRPARHRGRRQGRPVTSRTVVDGPARVWHAVAGRGYLVSAGSFWQVHPLAASAFAAALLEELRPSTGERVLELYAGAGLLTALFAEAVGSAGAVLGLEGDPVAVADAADNLAGLPWAAVHQSTVNAAAVAGRGPVDLVVLDPPRAGAGPSTMAAVAALGPRAIGYLACDPVALARDVAAARAHGYQLQQLRGIDAFPMTHHVECVAILGRADRADVGEQAILAAAVVGSAG